MVTRHLLPFLETALADTPAVFLAGPRQVGKSTLAQTLSEQEGRRYLTLDDVAVLAAATTDPAGFIAGLGERVVLDEVHRAPGLLLPLKAAIDRERRPGRFLLTGSAAVLVQPAIAEALVGRVELLTLWPFSQGEPRGLRESFVDALFADALDTAGIRGMERREAAELVVTGGFPEVHARDEPARREAWFRAYVSTLLLRDVRDLAAIDRVAHLPRLLRLLVERAGALANAADLSRSAALPLSTLNRYVILLESVFLVRRLPPWSGNRTLRLVKTPKFYPVDTGVGAHLLDLDADALESAPERFGPLLEAFVLGEVVKQLGWNRVAAAPYFCRTHAGDEVDLVLEDRRGRCVAIEVKSAATLDRADFRGIERFATVAGRRFQRGVVLYLGREVVPFGERRHALPLSALWTLQPGGSR